MKAIILKKSVTFKALFLKSGKLNHQSLQIKSEDNFFKTLYARNVCGCVVIQKLYTYV